MALAAITDVEARLGRTVTDEELVLVATLLGDAESMLLTKLPAALTRAATDLPYRATVVAVEAMAVVRVLRNPEGYRFEQTGPFSYSLDSRAAAGFLTILDTEWAQLGHSAGFSIDTVPATVPALMPYRVYDYLFGWR
jgi:hypothetical protein